MLHEITEERFVEIINKISSRLAQKFRFGYHEVEDMKQQAAIFALEALERYDGVRPLENFLWVHIRNRLYNYKRDNYFRPTSPCSKCPLNAWHDNECTAYENMMNCEWYCKWSERNETRKRLMSTPESTEAKKEYNIVDNLMSNDIYKLIDREIPLDFRSDWIRLTNDARINSSRRAQLLEVIFEILRNNNIEL